MNLIGNSCIASYITRDCLKQPFSNPFTWCIMNFESCFNLVKYYDSINFTHFKLQHDSKWNFSIIIDDLIEVQYVHYHFEPNSDKVTIKNNDVFYNKIWIYITNKYISRTKRMLELNEPPTFIFATANYGLSRHTPFTVEQQKQLLSLNSPYKIVLSFKENIKSANNLIIDQHGQFFDNGPCLSNYIFKQCGFLH